MVERGRPHMGASRRLVSCVVCVCLWDMYRDYGRLRLGWVLCTRMHIYTLAHLPSPPSRLHFRHASKALAADVDSLSSTVHAVSVGEAGTLFRV